MPLDEISLVEDYGDFLNIYLKNKDSLIRISFEDIADCSIAFGNIIEGMREEKKVAVLERTGNLSSL